VASPAGERNVFRFGLFEADPGSGKLLKQGEPVPLQDQPFRMLCLLLLRPGEIVTREELREKLWPQNTFVEFDGSLNVAVKKLRDALGDSADNPRFVETVPRRGYRFIAPVSVKTTTAVAAKEASAVSKPSASSTAGPAIPDVTPARPARRMYYWGAGVLAVVAGVLLVRQFDVRRTAEPSAPIKPPPTVTLRRTVAVLEFQNVSRRPSDDWLSTAIAEMLTTELGAGEKVLLVPAEDVSRMKRELHVGNTSSLGHETAIAAGKNLKADMLVVGSFTALGAGRNRRVRVDVRMQNAGSGDIVAEIAETAVEQQLFELVSRAGTRLREALGFAQAPLLDIAAARAALPSNPEAARLYAQGLARLHILDAAGARDLLAQAVAAEPKFPLAHMALASAWRTLGYDQKARIEGKKALDLSSGLPRADKLLIEGRYHEMMGEMEQAIAAYRALFTLFPDSLEDGLLLAEAQAWAGKPADSLATLDVLRKLPEPLSQDPRIDLRSAGAMSLQGTEAASPLLLIRRAEEKGRAQGTPLLVAKAQVMECSQLLFTGHYDEATRACEEAQRVFTAAGNAADAAQAVRFLGDIRMRRGRLQEALELFQQALKINQDAGDERGMAVSFNEMAIVYEGEGDLKHAEEVYRRAYLLFLKLGHIKNAAILATNVGGTLLEQARLAEAESMFGRAMELARQSGSTDAEAAAHRTLAELARLRGRLEDALEHTRRAESSAESDPFAQVDDLSRVGKVLALQADMAGARAKLQQALSVAEKTGAKAQIAQSRIGLARLDLEEGAGHAAPAEQPIRDALAVFAAEKMHDDELSGQILLSHCLLAQGKVEEASAVLNQLRNAVSSNQNPVNRLLFAIADARVADARVKTGAAPPSRSPAHAKLQQSIKEAGRLGLIPLQYEAELAWDELELSENPTAGKKNLESLASSAHAHGLESIARRATASRTRGNDPAGANR
jgi:eukaryotic-like serine/threonine-protein kinase